MNLSLVLALLELIDYYTIFKLSEIVSTGHMKVPSGAYFNAAYPPFPDVIDFLMDWTILTIENGSVTYSHIIMNLYGLHFELTSFEPCKTLIQTLTDEIFVPNKVLNT